MASQTLHQKKALKFQAMLGNVPIDQPEWKITVIFYVVVHWIRAFLAKHGVASGFTERMEYVYFGAKLAALDQITIVNVFNELKSLSQHARYMCFDELEYQQMAREDEKHYRAIKNAMQQAGIQVETN